MDSLDYLEKRELLEFQAKLDVKDHLVKEAQMVFLDFLDLKANL
jgi:hypothetical protein